MILMHWAAIIVYKSYQRNQDSSVILKNVIQAQRPDMEDRHTHTHIKEH